MGVVRSNQEHKTHPAYHDLRVSGKVPGESWRPWRVCKGSGRVLEGPGESGSGSGRVLESLGTVLGESWRLWEKFWERFWGRFWEKFWEKFWEGFREGLRKVLGGALREVLGGVLEGSWESGKGLGLDSSIEVLPCKKNLSSAASNLCLPSKILVVNKKENINLSFSKSDLHTFSYKRKVKHVQV